MADFTPDFRKAEPKGLAILVDRLIDDRPGAARPSSGGSTTEAFAAAAEAIGSDPGDQLPCACRDCESPGVLQLSFLPSLTCTERRRARIERVRARRDARSQGEGRRSIEEAVRRPRVRSCRIVQLATDQSSPQVVAFYETLGFTPSQQGMKMHLPDRAG